MIDDKFVAQILTLAEDLEIEVWLDGGWGVDALLGRQTRDHADLDLILRTRDIPIWERELLKIRFHEVSRDSPANFVLSDDRERQIDIHGIEFDDRGFGCFKLADGRLWPMPPSAFAGSGVVAGKPARCLSDQAQVQCHGQGYEPTETDLQDMENLQERFQVVLPLPLCRQRPMA